MQRNVQQFDQLGKMRLIIWVDEIVPDEEIEGHRATRCLVVGRNDSVFNFFDGYQLEAVHFTVGVIRYEVRW